MMLGGGGGGVSRCGDAETRRRGPKSARPASATKRSQNITRPCIFFLLLFFFTNPETRIMGKNFEALGNRVDVKIDRLLYVLMSSLVLKVAMSTCMCTSDEKKKRQNAATPIGSLSLFVFYREVYGTAIGVEGYVLDRIREEKNTHILFRLTGTRAWGFHTFSPLHHHLILKCDCPELHQ